MAKVDVSMAKVGYMCNTSCTEQMKDAATTWAN